MGAFFVGSLASVVAVDVAARAQARTASATPAAAPAYDLLIQQARIVDGSGSAWYRGDIAIAGDRIVRIAPTIDAAAARRTIDARQLVAAPGFIDIHTHARRGIFDVPTAEKEAVRKMSAFPAQRLSLTDRGLLRPGLRADVVLFDPDRVRDRATFEQPHQYAEGVSTVLVNGQIIFEHGAMTTARPGRVLYGPGSQPR